MDPNESNIVIIERIGDKWVIDANIGEMMPICQNGPILDELSDYWVKMAPFE